jgi:hypothetical protein
MVLGGGLMAACSGGGSNGSMTTTSASTTASVPAPTATATTTGPLALAAFAVANIGAPVPASLGGNAPLIASDATPSFANLPTGATFPLNQAELTSDPLESQITGFTYPAGATLTFLGNKQINGVSVGTFEFKIANIDITLTGDGSAATIPNSGNTQIGLTTSNLNYTLLASWVLPSNNGLNVSITGVGVSGYQTPGSGVPTSGTGTYFENGGATGTVVVPAAFTSLKGDVTVNVNFGTGSVNGALTNMNAGTGAAAAPWNNVSLSGSLSGATLAGSTAATSSPSGIVSFGAGATGTFNGALYGPGGQELGAVWSLHEAAGGGKSALGLIGASRQ